MSLCFLTDILKSTNVLQTILQGARLNFLKIPNPVANLVQTLQRKSDHPEEPKGCCFGRLQEFFDVAAV